MYPCLPHQPGIKAKVLDTCQLHPQDFPGTEKMPEVCLGVFVAGFSWQPLIQDRKITSPFLIFNIDYAPGCKEHAISSVSGGHDTIKHINPRADTFQQVPGCSH